MNEVYNRGRRRLDQSSLKRFLSDDSIGSSLSSESLERCVDFGSIDLNIEPESSFLVKVESSLTGGSKMNWVLQSVRNLSGLRRLT